MNPKLFSKKSKKSFSSNNKVSKEKIKKKLIKKLQKADLMPAPRSLGQSKLSLFVEDAIGRSQEVDQQGGVVTNDIPFFTFEQANKTLQTLLIMQCCTVKRYRQLRDPSIPCSNVDVMADFVYSYYVNSDIYRDELNEIWERSSLETLENLEYNMSVFGDIISTTQNFIRDNFPEHYTVPQGGLMSMENGLPVNVNFDPQPLTEFGQTILGDLHSMVEDFRSTPIEVEHSITPNRCTNLLSYLWDNKLVIGIVILTYLGLNAIFKGGRFVNVFNIVAALSCGFIVSYPALAVWLQQFIDKVRQYCTVRSEVEQQAGIVDLNLVDVISKFAMCGIFTSHCTDFHADTVLGVVNEFFGRTANLRRVHDGMTFSLEFVFKMVQDFFNWFADLANISKIKIVDDPFWEISIFGEVVHSKKLEYTSDPLKDSAFAGELEQIRGQGETLRSKIARLPNCHHQLSILSGHMKVLNDLIIELGTRLVTVNGTRPEPFIFLCLGTCDIGKTSFVNVLAPEITAETLPDSRLDHFAKHPGEYIYTYNASDAFYSGYHGQYNLMVDELGYMRDVANGSPTIWSELIGWINVNPMNLNMADLGSKGRVYFRSKCIWGTSNQKHFRDIDSVNDKQAIYRRLKFTWIAAVKPEFATEDTVNLDVWNRKPNWNLVNAADARTDFSYLQFFRMTNLGTGDYCNVPVEADELRRLTLEAISRNEDNHVDLQTKISDRVNAVLLRRGAQPMQQAGERCGRCPGCNNLLYKRDEEIFTNFHRRVFNSLSNNGIHITIGDTIIDFDTYFSRIVVAFADEGLRGRTRQIDCALEASDLNELVVMVVVKTSQNRANRLFGLHRIPTVLGKFMNYCKKIGKALKYIVPIACFGLGAYKLYRYFCSGKTEDDDDDDHPEGSDTPSSQGDYPMRKGKRNRKPNKNKKNSRVYIQAGDDPNAHNITTKLVTRNVWRFDIKLGENRNYQGCVLVLQNNIVLMPEHYISRWMDYVNGCPEEDIVADPNLEITFTNCNYVNPTTGAHKNHCFTRTLSDLLRNYTPDGEKTLEIVKFTENVEDDVGICYIPGITGRSISHLFRSKDAKIPTQHRGMLGLVNRDYCPVYHTSTYSLKEDIIYKDGTWGCAKAIQYDIPTRTGDCGSPFVLFDKTNEAKIISIHIAGIGNTQGLGVIVEREGVEAGIQAVCTFNNLLRDLNEKSAAREVEPLMQGGVTFGDDNRVYDNKVKSIPQSRKTKIVPSPIHNMMVEYKPRKQPAMLVKTGNIDPMQNAMFGYGLSNKRPRLDLYRCAVLDYCNEVYSTNYIITKQMRRTLTFEEAVMGIPGEDFLDGINRTTSPGWPLKLLLSKGSKKSAFGHEEYIFEGQDCAMVRRMTEHVEDCIKSGIRPYILNNHFLKDELRSIHKSEIGASRLISSCDMVFAILLRKYTLMFSAFMMRSRVDNGVACGVNPYSNDWDHLARRHGNNFLNFRVVAGDFSSYDKCLAPEDIWAVKVVMTQFYCDHGQETEFIRNALVDEIAQSRHTVNGLVYSWMGGNTSGNTLTAMLNSIIGCILDRYAILNSHPKPVKDYYTAEIILEDMKLYVKITHYGDDGLLSVQTNGPFDFITQEFMTKAYAEIGMIYTDEDKNTTFRDRDRRLVDCTFLKRGFIKSHYCDNHRWMGNLSMDTILESIQWSKDHDSGWAFWKTNVDHMLTELSAHDKKTFDYWAPIIISACANSDVGHTVVMPSYRDLQDKFVGLDMKY